MRQLHAQERSGIRGHGSRKRGSEPGEEGLHTAATIQLTHDGPDTHVPLGRLQPTLDRVDGEDGDPHGHARGATCTRNSEQTQVALGFSGGRVAGRQAPLDILVGREVRRAAGSVSREGGHAPAEDGADPALGVELAHDVDAAFVFRLLARLETLALDLQDDFHALKGGGDGRHGDRAEESGGGDLRYREALGAGRRDGCHELLAHVVAPE